MQHAGCLTLPERPLLRCRPSGLPAFGSRFGQQQGSRLSSGVCNMKKDLHPEYFEEAKVFCNGEEVLTTSGTQQSYTVDVWSGNHPFFQGAANTVLMDEGSVNRFKRRYSGLDSLTDMSRIKTGGNQNVDLTAFKKGKGKKQKGKK